VNVKIKKDPVEDQVVLFVKGKEKTEVEDREGSKSSTTEAESHVFFETHLVLSEHTILEPGTHSFPFSLSLPDYLPTSTYPSAEHIVHGIQYKCIVYLAGRKKEVLFQVLAAKNSCGTQVRKVSGPKTDRIILRRGGRMPKDVGEISWAAAVDNNRLGRRGRKPVLSVSCRNHSKVDIVEVIYKLIEEWHWSAGHCHSTRTNVLIPITRMQLPSNMTSRSAQSLPEQNVLSFFNEIRGEVDSHKYSSRINLDPEVYDCAHDSYQGKLIQVSHYIQVELKLPAGYYPLVTMIPVIIADFEETREPAWLAIAQAEAVEVSSRKTFHVAKNDDASIPFASAVPYD
jgi:hypothetical protein